jgi:hypothetical protein
MVTKLNAQTRLIRLVFFGIVGCQLLGIVSRGLFLVLLFQEWFTVSIVTTARALPIGYVLGQLVACFVAFLGAASGIFRHT